MNEKAKATLAITAAFFCSAIFAQQAENVELKTVVEKPAICHAETTIFDPEIPLASKEKDLAGLAIAADSGMVMAQYLLGTLYRLGEDHPAKAYTQDLQRAKIYLSNSAINGNIQAMAAMAEIELKNKNYRDAMLWAQVFTHYEALDLRKYNKDSNQAYSAYLLQRIMQVTNKDKKLYPETMFLDDLKNFHASHNTKIIHGQSNARLRVDATKYDACLDKKKGEGDATNYPKLESGQSINSGGMVNRKIHTPGYAYFLLEIDPQGRVSGVFTVDSLPDANYAKALTSVAKRLKFNRIEGTNMRSAYLPMSYDDFSAAIKKTGAKK